MGCGYEAGTPQDEAEHAAMHRIIDARTEDDCIMASLLSTLLSVYIDRYGVEEGSHAWQRSLQVLTVKGIPAYEIEDACKLHDEIMDAMKGAG